jgi:hypothetical protein
LNLTQAQSRHDNRIDYIAEAVAASERREAAIRAQIESDPERVANAVCDYWAGTTLACDAPELLTEWTVALAASGRWLDCIANGESIPDSELQSLRALLRVVETAKQRQASAVDDAVEGEMLK